MQTPHVSVESQRTLRFDLFVANGIECRFGTALHLRDIFAAFVRLFAESEHIVENVVVECVESSGVAQCRIDAFRVLRARSPARFPEVSECHAHKAHPPDGHRRILRNFRHRIGHVGLRHRLPHRFQVGRFEQLPVQRAGFGAEA